VSEEKSLKKTYLYALFFVIVILYLGYYISRNSEQFSQLASVSPGYLAVVALGSLAGIFVNGLFMKVILVPYKKDIQKSESFFVSLISTMGNYFLPMGTGTGIKAVYLKRKFQLNYSDFISTLSGNYIIVFLINAGLGCLAVLMLRDQAPLSQTRGLLLVLGGIFIGMIVLATYGFPRVLLRLFSRATFLRKLTSAIERVLIGWNKLTEDKSLIIKLILLTLLNYAITVMITLTALLALDLPINLWVLFLYTSLASLSLLLNVTPGSIGVREAMFIIVSATLGLSVADILSISIITNGTLFFVLTVSWLLFQIPWVKRRFVPKEVATLD
jgi:uncharacterized protein (TIRG00374 family)